MIQRIYQLTPAIFCILLLISACGGPVTTQRQWPEADQLFRDKALFLGADSAYSADIGNGRVLWLFGDTFVGGIESGREGGTMIRNSLAIQQGYNPETATITFYFGDQTEEVFPLDGETWLWPGPAVKIEEKLLLTFFEVERQEAELGFRAIGSAAYLVSNPDAEPSEWVYESLDLPSLPPGVRFGTGALLLENDYLYAYMVIEPGFHDVYLARWEISDVIKGDLGQPEWFDLERGWGQDTQTPLAENVQTEFSVHKDPDTGEYWMISVDGFGSTNIVKRVSASPEGPWSEPQFVARPAESNRGDILVYSAKAHPHLTGGKTIITYSTNSLDFGILVADMSIYFPRFLREE